MKNRIIYITLSLTITFALPLEVLVGKEEADIAALLKAKMQEARGSARDLTVDIRITDEKLQAADPQQVLAVLAPYEKDPQWSVRHMAHIIIARVANMHPVTEIRQEVARRLLEAEFNATDRGAVTLLMNFTAKDFNSGAREMIRQALARENISRHHVLICGVANIEEELPHLKELLIDEIEYQAKTKRRGKKWYYTVGWAARLARARIGVKEEINKCIELVDAEKDFHARVTRLLHDTGYIRQPAAITYLQGYLESDQRLSAVSPPIPGEPVSSYVMSILAECLRNYPVKRREARGYAQEEIDLCRKWMAQQTTWDVRR
jgi:hypothetical protein